MRPVEYLALMCIACNVGLHNELSSSCLTNLESLGLITRAIDRGWKLTDRGQVLVNHIAALRLPVERKEWLMPKAAD